ncbi:MAG: PKD domain protein [Methanoregulaceae archaeon PtaB.Bin108]|nr:MAG: PKD domain protein [Methanoregulaceae archaeon PtaB.Bin108]
MSRKPRICIVLCAVILLLCAIMGPVSATEYTLNSSATKEIFQNTVSGMNDGDILNLDPGTYFVNGIAIPNTIIIRANAETGGNRENTIINGSGGQDGIFQTPGSDSLSINNLTIEKASSTYSGGVIHSEGGNITVDNVTIRDVWSAGYGGAFYSSGGSIAIIKSNISGATAWGNGGAAYTSDSLGEYGSVTVISSTISNCSAGSSAEPYLWGGGNGGAIRADGLITVDTSIFFNCTSNSYNPNILGGGAICSGSNPIVVTSSTFINCSETDGHGGAISSQGGAITVTATSFTHCSAYGCGGAIYTWDVAKTAPITITSCTFSHCSAGSGSQNGYGGAIYSTTFSTLLMVNSSTFSNCTGIGGDGGGAILNYGDAIITSSTFSNCSAIWNGGGMGGAVLATGNLTVTDSAFSHCSAKYYGGALFAGKNLTVDSSIFSDCSGVAIYGNGGEAPTTVNSSTFSNCSGGAIRLWKDLTVTNSTFTNCSATTEIPYGIGGGGAIFVLGTVTVTSSAFSDCSIYPGSFPCDGGGAIYAFNAIVDSTSFTNCSATGTYGGGAICTGYQSPGLVLVNSSTFSNCSSIGSTTTGGGAIYATTVIMNSSSISNCSTSENGGAIFSASDVSVSHSTFSDCSAAGKNGGALYSDGQVSVSGSTFSGCSAFDGGAVFSPYAMNAINSIFSDCSAMNGSGGALSCPSLNMVNMTFSGCSAGIEGGAISCIELAMVNTTFSGCSAGNNGGAISSVVIGSLVTMVNSTFSGCSAGNNGGAIYSTDTIEVGYSIFSDCSAMNGDGGAIFATGSGFSIGSVVCSTFTNCTAANGHGSAVYCSGPEWHIQGCRLVNNTGTTVFSPGSTTNATYNWWGSNNDPSAQVSGAAYSPWLMLGINATPASISTAETSLVRASLTYDSDGIYHDPVKNIIPDGIPIVYTLANGGGSILPLDGRTVNGTNTTVYTPPAAPGTATINATVDGQTVSTVLEITGNVPPVAPVAAFIADKTSGTAPLSVVFTDQSTGNVSSWAWTFGDGGTSNTSNPNYIYSVPGTYTVNLTVTGPGGTDSESKTNYITVADAPVAPVANFTYLSECPNPLFLQFTDTSLNDPTQWSWNFGDGETSTLRNPNHTYSAYGGYNLTLTVSNLAGSNSTTRIICIIACPLPVYPPVAHFTANATYGQLPLPIQFTDNSTGEAITSRLWTFGDGGTSTDTNPIHLYTTPGLFTVSLEVTNDGGSNTSTRTDYIHVFDATPIADFIAEPQSGDAPLPVQFHDTSVGSPTGWQWDFGDGTTTTLQSPSHTYTTPGNYTVTLTAGSSGGTNTTIKADFIQVMPEGPPEVPVANFTADIWTGRFSAGADFYDSSTGNPDSWNWSFGDGSYSEERNPWHYYQGIGSYPMSLTVSNSEGSDTITRDDFIVIPTPPPEADFSGSPRYGTFPLTVEFTDYSIGSVDWDTPPATYEWNFGDGSPNSTDKGTVNHHYMAAGTYTVTLTVTDIGGSDTLALENYIGEVPPPQPIADFTATPKYGFAPLTVDFIDQSTGSPLLTYTWDLGDGNASYEKNPSHIYSSPGLYNVTLQTTNVGGSDTITKAGFIEVLPAPEVLPLHADFTSNVTTGTMPITVQFNDSSTGNPSSWSWVFEKDSYYPVGEVETTQAIPYYGNEFSHETNPVVTYSYPGNYSVSLTVSRTGETDTITKEEYIKVIPPPPVADFITYNSEGPAPLEVEFDAYVPYWYYIDEWVWEFGDGTTYWRTSPWITHTYYIPGLYNVTLTVNSLYGNDTLTKVHCINVTQELPPMVSFNATPRSGDAPLSVAFTDTSSGTVTSRFWDFGDGTTEWANATPDVTHSYSLPGNYTVSLTAGNDGGQATATKAEYIQVNSTGTPPDARFTLTPMMGYGPLTVRFTDHSRGMPLKWLWDFGDGNTSSEQNPSHTYTTPGRYLPRLTVYNSGGNDSSTSFVWIRSTKFVFPTITPSPTITTKPTIPPRPGYSPISFFAMNKSFGSAPLTVQFTDRSFNNPTSWQWVFGDGQTSTERNPVNTFTDPGRYSVSLKVKNAVGESMTSRTVYVR